MITFDPTWPQLLSLLVSIVLPLLVGLVTTHATSAAVKASLLAVLAFASGLGTELLAALNAGVSYDLAAGAFSGVATFLVAVGVHYGLWKPTGTSRQLQAIGARRDEDGVYHVSSLPETPELDRVPNAPDHRAE